MSETLPKCVYLKHGAFYLVKNGKWHFLTKDRSKINEQLMLRFGILNGLVPSGRIDLTSRPILEAYTLNVLARARQNAKGRNKVREFTLTPDEVLGSLRATKYRCSVTGTPLSLEVLSTDGRKPFAPSIDRIDNARGYTADNCRIVCLAANIAMNTWGEGVLLTMLKYAKGFQSIGQLTFQKDTIPVSD